MSSLHYKFRRLNSIILGTVFFLSGMLKLMDPVGAGLVVNDYFKFMHLGFLGFAAKETAFILAGIETVLGIALLAGVFRKMTAIATTIVLGGFTLLTVALVIFNPEMDCGCFGEAIHLTHKQTLIKNIILCAIAAATFLPTNYFGLAPRRKYIAFVIICVTTTLFAIFSQTHLPLMDFTDFVTGSELMASQETDLQNGEELPTVFIYEKNGDEKSFTLDDLPDSTWTFVRTETLSPEVLSYGEVFPVLSISDAEGNYFDEMAVIGNVLAITVYDPSKIREGLWDDIAEAIRTAEDEGFTPLLLSSSAEGVPDELDDYLYFSDYKTLITFNRSNGGYNYISDGEIIRKWPKGDGPDIRFYSRLKEKLPEEIMLDKNTQDRLSSQAILLFSFAVLLLM